MLVTLRTAAIAAISTLVLASAAHAAPASSVAYGEPRSVAVRYGDLDLSTPAGAARLERRVAYAVRQVCGRPDPRELALSRLAAACRADTLARAKPHMETALAAARARTDVAQSGGASALDVNTVNR